LGGEEVRNELIKLSLGKTLVIHTDICIFACKRKMIGGRSARMMSGGVVLDGAPEDLGIKL
jgi:hypothetical protein